jgi:chaperone required for assembly of F1-ATPase
MKRFYREVQIGDQDSGMQVLLDGRPVRTPAKNLLSLPTRPLADGIAAEWNAQDETIDPESMVLTRLANSAIDSVGQNRDLTVTEIARFTATDLVCYRVADPDELAVRQNSAWQPLVDWAAGQFQAELAVTDGLLPVAQSEACLSALRVAIEAFDDFPLTGLHAATAACGSVVMGLALGHGRIDGETAWEYSLIDETYQIESWGEDYDAADRRAALKRDIAAAAEFLTLSRNAP